MDKAESWQGGATTMSGLGSNRYEYSTEYQCLTGTSLLWVDDLLLYKEGEKLLTPQN